MIAGGLANHGFSLIEAIVQCPTAYGRKNRMGSPAAMLSWMKDAAVMKTAWDKLPPEKRTAEQFPIGLLCACAGEEYGTANAAIQQRAGGL